MTCKAIKPICTDITFLWRTDNILSDGVSLLSEVENKKSM